MACPQDKPGTRVGVVGLGGLGHMAVKLAKAFGCEVSRALAAALPLAAALVFPEACRLWHAALLLPPMPPSTTSNRRGASPSPAPAPGHRHLHL
jgi:threonine dehydrogenase-like Zn-dependent dehydrogenase